MRLKKISNFLTLPELLRVLADTSHRKRRVRSVSWNNDGTKLATGSDDKTVKIWAVGSAGTFECQSTLTGHSQYVTAVSYYCLFSNVWCVLTIEHFTAGF